MAPPPLGISASRAEGTLFMLGFMLSEIDQVGPVVIWSFLNDYWGKKESQSGRLMGVADRICMDGARIG
jgi:hypothetical protein